jgi:1-aminocyclopropane-1-carboxylate synthase
MKSTSAFHSISTHTQVVLTQLLGDEEFVSSFLQLSKERLTDCYRKVKRILQDNGIEFYDPQAGQFFWVNLAPLMRKKLGKDTLTFDDELVVWRGLAREAKVFVFAGQFFKCNSAGWFRVCFTCKSIPTIELSIQRLVKWFQAK